MTQVVTTIRGRQTQIEAIGDEVAEIIAARDEALAQIAAANAGATGLGLPLGTRAEAMLYEVPEDVDRVSVIHPPIPAEFAMVHSYTRSDDCEALVTADGAHWRPDRVDDVRAWGGWQGDTSGDYNLVAANAALAYCGAAYFAGGGIWFLNGSLLAQDWLSPNLAQAIHIYGDGQHVTKLQQLDLTADTIIVKHRNLDWNPALPSQNGENTYHRVKMKPVIHDLSIRYATGALTNQGGRAIYLHECKDGVVRDLNIDGPDYFIYCERAVQMSFERITGLFTLRDNNNPAVASFVMDDNRDLAAQPKPYQNPKKPGMSALDDLTPGKSFGNSVTDCEVMGDPGTYAHFVLRACDGLNINGRHYNGHDVFMDLTEIDGTGERTTCREITMDGFYSDGDGQVKWMIDLGPYRTPVDYDPVYDDLITITGITVGPNVTFRGRGGSSQNTGLVRLRAPNPGDLDHAETISNLKFMGMRLKAMHGTVVRIVADPAYDGLIQDIVKQWTFDGLEMLEGQFDAAESDDAEKPLFILNGSMMSIKNCTISDYRDQADKFIVRAGDQLDGLDFSNNTFRIGTTKFLQVVDGAQNIRDIGNVNLDDIADGGTAPGEFMIDGADIAGLRFDTRADLVAWIADHTQREGALLRIGDLTWRAVDGATAIDDMPGYLPVGKVYPDHFAENEDPGTTNMRDAIAAAHAYAVNVHYKAREYLCSGNVITLDEDFTMTGEGWSSGYGGGTSRGTIITEARTTAGNVFAITGATSAFSDRVRSAVTGIAFKSASSKALTDLSAVTITLFKLTNTFLNTFTDCAFLGLNVTEAIGGNVSGSQNALFVSRCHFESIGDAATGFSGVTGRYTYGKAVNTVYIPDSSVENCFFELCGSIALTLGANCRSLNNFNDLSYRGYDIYGYRAQIIGGTCKWHQTSGVYAQADAADWLVDDLVIIGNNYANATGNSENFAVRLTSGNTGWRVTNVYAADALSGSHPDKTKLQNFFHFGSAGNSGHIDGATIGTPETGGTNLYDPNANIATGAVKIGTLLYVGTTGFVTSTTQAVISADAVVAAATGMTAGKESVAHGVVQTSAATTLFSASRTALGPFFLADEKPTYVTDKTGGANTGAISVDGFAYRADYVHTGGGGSETNVVAPAPDKFLGHLEIAYGDDSTRSFFYAGHVKWDGATLTELDTITTTSSIGSLALSVSGGNLLLATTTSTACTGKMLVKFRGTWMQSS